MAQENKTGTIILVILMIVVFCVLGYVVYVSSSNVARDTRTGDTEIELETARATPRGSDNYAFDDGLRKPDTSAEFALDETGAGMASREVWHMDINGDGKSDKITRTRQENGTSHFYYEYQIELNSGNGFVDITPSDFRTVEGADCALQKLRFAFTPNFVVTKISRKWDESWVTPTAASKTTYTLMDNKLQITNTKQLRKICNVSDLFD